jgi:hypothetical protein
VRAFLGMLINHVMHQKFFERYGDNLLNISNRQAAEKYADLFLAGIKNPDHA